MKKIVSFLNDCHIKNKLMIIYACTCFIPMLILSCFSYMQMNKIIKNEEKKNFETFLLQAIDTIDGQVKIYDNLSDYIAFNQSISQLLTYEYKSTYEMYSVIVNTFDPLLSSVKYFHDEIKQVTLYVEGNVIKHGTTLAPISEIETCEWYDEVRSDLDIHWYADYDNKKVYAARRMPMLEKEGICGVLYIEVDYYSMFEALTMNGAGYGVIAVDDNNKLLYVYDSFEDRKDYIPYDEFTKQVEKSDFEYNGAVTSNTISFSGSKYLVAAGKQDISKFNIFFYKPERLITGYIKPMIYVILLTLILCVLSYAAAAYLVTKLIIRRIDKLNGNMKCVEEGKLEITVTSDEGDEIGELIRGFGSMIEKLAVLINVVYEGKLKEKEYQMKALQAQINPHFLYNTLSMINWKAIAAGNDDISAITLSLASFYRTALNKGSNILKVSSELENVRSYLKIQLFMHDYEFDVVENIDEEILEYNSLNLILQPVVENAIGHGIELKEDGRGVITINGCLKDGCVVFEIIDNGAGMEPDKAVQILSDTSKGYGVRNVNERIKLYYGEEYSIRIESEPGRGTKVIIRIPALKE